MKASVIESKFQITSDKIQSSIRFPRVNPLCLLTVILPTLLAMAYFGFMASDVYISESHFVVRTHQAKQQSIPNSLQSLLPASFSHSSNDMYTVQDFLASRDALAALNEEFHLKELYGAKNIDIISRFAGLEWWNKSFEALHLYYKNHVTVQLVDTTSPVSVLVVKAFTAEDAYRINEMLLKLSEDFINKLNERAKQDMIGFASAQVDIAEEKAKAATLALSHYRNKNAVFDPEGQSKIHLQEISRIQEALISTKTQLALVRTASPENPQIPSLKKRVETLQSEMNTHMSKIVGGNLSLSDRSAEYDLLVLDRTVADSQLASALSSLEQARIDARQKQLYLERVSQPIKPDYPMEPRKVRAVFATFLIGLILWGILSLLIAGIREHQD